MTSAHISSNHAGNNSFEQHLENASKIVTSWPAWKQTILGTPANNDAQTSTKATGSQADSST